MQFQKDAIENNSNILLQLYNSYIPEKHKNIFYAKY